MDMCEHQRQRRYCPTCLEAARTPHENEYPPEHPLAVRIDYTNWKGERGWRTIVPNHIHFAATEWHPQEQWLLRAYDIAKRGLRDFALKDIHHWENKP